MDQSGRPWTLLGHAFQTEQDAPDPVEALGLHRGDVEDMTRTWTGRWVLVGGEELWTDLSTLMGCLYRTIEDGDTAGIWMSSSLALLAALPGSPAPGQPEQHFGWSVGVDWNPPPLSRYPGIRRGLASQVLDFSDGKMTTRHRRLPLSMGGPGNTSTDLETLLDTVEMRLVTAMKNIAKTSTAPLWLALTAGGDSRLLLAAAYAAGIDVETFTQELPFHRWGQGLADRRLPPVLAKELGYEHHFLARHPEDARLLELWDEHTTGEHMHGDRDFFSRRQWEPIPTGTTVIRAGVFEAAECDFWKLIPPTQDPAEQLQAVMDYADRQGRPLTDHQVAGISEWIEWIHQHPDPDADWRDLLLLEQWAAAWLGPVEQGLDCTGLRSIHPGNCWTLLQELMSFDLEMRSNVGHHRLLIERMAPQLLKYPINPPDSLSTRIAAKVVREGYRVRHPSTDGSYLRNLGHRVKSLMSGPEKH